MNLINSVLAVNKLIAIFVILLILAADSLAASQHKELVFQRVALNFIPEKAVIIVEYTDGMLVEYQSLIIPGNVSGAAPDEKDWIAGTYIESLPANPARKYDILILDKDKQSTFIPDINMDNPLNIPSSDSVEKIREEIKNRNAVLDSLAIQADTQSNSLRRLRADAEIVANLSRIVEVVEEIEITKSEIVNLDKDLELLQGTFQAVKKMPKPKNYLRRELELTKQSDELIKLVKATERDEDSRRTDSQSDIQQKLKVIENARYEDEDKLREQLVRLKTHKIRPDEIRREAGEEVKNYWETQ